MTAPVPQLVAPTIAAGRTALGDQMYAERLGDTVVVSFDTETGRTRRADKLERIIRVTLPKVFGAVADSTLVALADRQLVAPRANLVANLASEGLQLASPDGSSRFAIHASVREGRDGPLVVGYRAILVR